jgi:folate-binding protein YgfZ
MVDVSAQRRAIDEGALLRPAPDLGTLVVTGEERQSWLAGMVTNDIKGLRPGEGRFALNVTKNGRLQAEMWIVIDAVRILVGVAREHCERVRDLMEAYLIMEDAEIGISETPYSWWIAHGPRAEAVARAARELGAVAGVGPLAEIPSAMIAAPSDPRLGDALLGVPGAMLATPDGWERVRVERAIPRLGVDFELDMYPQEAALEHLGVSFNKGCYVGQEAVFMLEKRGHVKKRVVRLEASGDHALARGAEVTTPDGEQVGEVTSAVAGDGKTWALAMVRYKHSASGTALRVGDVPVAVSCIAAREACV